MLADSLQRRLDRYWSDGGSAYRIGGGGAVPAANGQLLVAHAVAAQQGHDGASRNDHRARLIARRLVDGPPFVDGLTGRGSHRHAPGWVNSLRQQRATRSRAAAQH